MPNLLDTLEALERAATAPPWEAAEDRTEHYGVIANNRIVADTWPRGNDNAALIAAARNALPALLRLARAVREERAAALAMDKALTDEAFRAAAARYNRATLETTAALAAVGEGTDHA
jgi:hypothetical protein